MSGGSKDDEILTVVPTSSAGNLQDKRDRIIECAIIMFNRIGYDRVRISDITDSLDMGKGTFYLYFRNKRELLLACFDHVRDLMQLLESLPEIREGDFFTKIVPRVEFIHRYDWYPGLTNLVRGAETSPDDDIKAKAREAYEAIAAPLKRDLQAAIEAGLARDVDVELAIYGFIGMGEDVWFRSRLDDRYSLEQVTAFTVDATTRFLSAEPPGANPAPMRRETMTLLVDRDGMEFRLHDVRCNGDTTITGTLSRAQLDLDLARVQDLVLAECGDGHVADITMVDGTKLQLYVDGSAVISGDSHMGALRIALRDVSTLRGC